VGFGVGSWDRGEDRKDDGCERKLYEGKNLDDCNTLIFAKFGFY
jgi:hypothetical protein